MSRTTMGRMAGCGAGSESDINKLDRRCDVDKQEQKERVGKGTGEEMNNSNGSWIIENDR